MTDDLTDEDREALERLALDAIKATHKTGGRALTNPEIVAFLETPRTLFNGDDMMPKPPRGPSSSKTIWQHHVERMKGDFHRLIRWPRSGGRGRKGDTPAQDDIARIAGSLNLHDMPESERVWAVRLKLDLLGKPHDDKVIRDTLRTLGLYQGKTTPD